MSDSEIVIRPAHAGDVHQLRDLSRSTFYETYAENNTPDDIRMHMQRSFGIEKLTSELEDEGNRFFVACKGDQMIGYAKLRTSKPLPKEPGTRAIEIERIYVSKAHQGQKAGAALMDACLAYATKEGYMAMWLGVWEGNHQAIRFYEHWGFTVNGKQNFVLGEDLQSDYVMVKTL